MPLFNKTAALISMSFLALILSVSCKAPRANKAPQIKTAEDNKRLTEYPLRQHFKCLPESAAILAAHRGTSKGQGLAENSKAGLQALIDKGIMIAEIDVARTKDGVHFLFHDGVWEGNSTGKGPVSATLWKKAQTYLLDDTEGRVSSETPISLEDYLKAAKDNIYLEVDFKSSANYEAVIKLIRKYDMSDNVILISYSIGQARKLARLAPNMMVSVSVNKEDDLREALSTGLKLHNLAAWTGRNGPQKTIEKKLKDEGVPILTYPPRNEAKSLIRRSSLIVTDYALKQKPIIGRYDKSAYRACLNK